MRKSIVPLQLLLCLLGCGSPLAIASQPKSWAPIQFFKGQIDLGGIQWMESQADERGVTAGLHRISALSKNVAFLLGDINVSGGTLRSILLRTGDGGKHWIEVMNPVVGSSLQQVTFVDRGEGWALVMWTVEGPGLVTLYHTTDYGLTWCQWSEIPKWAWYGRPITMQFTDNRHGQIDMVYDMDLPPNNRIAHLTTADGGLTWKETSSFVPGNGSQEAIATAITTSCEGSTSDTSTSTGSDKSQWKTSDGSYETTQITISRRLITENNWTVVSIIPKSLKYSVGHLQISSLPK